MAVEWMDLIEYIPRYLIFEEKSDSHGITRGHRSVTRGYGRASPEALS